MGSKVKRLPLCRKCRVVCEEVYFPHAYPCCTQCGHTVDMCKQVEIDEAFEKWKALDDAQARETT